MHHILHTKMAYNNAYTIDYQGLPLGESTLEIRINNALFDLFPQSEIIDANAIATIILAKHHNFAELAIQITGTVTLPCDRCLDPATLPINWNSNCIIKVADKTPDADDPEIIYTSPNESTVSMAQYLYESVVLALPVSRVHDQIELCNQEVVKFIAKENIEQE